MQRKERTKKSESKQLYQAEYPDHLKHLYVAEAEKLKQEDWTNTVNRRKSRMKVQENTENAIETDCAAEPAETVVKEPGDGSEMTDSVTLFPEPTPGPEKEM